MIRITSATMYHHELGPIALARLLAQPQGAICARVTGNSSTDEAKMTGMTPAMLMRSGR